MNTIFPCKLTPTDRLYYVDQYLKECEATVTKTQGNIVITDRTIAFPEGGGQEGDHGIIVADNNRSIAFCDTQKGLGRPLFLNDFPSIQVDTPIHHSTDTDQHGLQAGDKVIINIDVHRRQRLTVSHTATHLLLIAVNRIAPSVSSNIKGCHIAPDYARLDFGVENKFTSDDLCRMIDIVNELVGADKEVRVYPHKDEPEAWYWECDGEVMPCGGMHLDHTGVIGNVMIKRRGMGKGKERVTVEFPNAIIDTSQYHS